MILLHLVLNDALNILLVNEAEVQVSTQATSLCHFEVVELPQYDRAEPVHLYTITITILYYSALYYTILYYTILYNSILYYSILI